MSFKLAKVNFRNTILYCMVFLGLSGFTHNSFYANKYSRGAQKLCSACEVNDSIDALEREFSDVILGMLGDSINHGIDSTVSPCEDFYQFVNGGWRARTSLPESKDRKHQSVTFFDYADHHRLREVQEILDSSRAVFSSTSDQTLRVLGTFYESCMVADTLEVNYATLRDPGLKIKDSTRYEKCLMRTLQYLGGAAGQAFAQRLKESGAVARMESLLTSIKEAVKQQLQRNLLMSDFEKEHALNRFNLLGLRVGIPDTSVDYTGLFLSPVDYEKNKAEIGSFDNSQWVGSLGSNIRERWKMSLLMANAVYIPGDHAIEIPALMFSPPFFFVDEKDELLNFAGIGYVIGHEIFHSIAPQLTIIEDSLMQGEISRFKQFHTSLGELEGWKTDGERTFNEDVADLGGIRVAYSAWKETTKNRPDYRGEVINGYTPDQRFFIAMGRIWRAKWTKSGIVNGVHGPYFARVNAAAMQSKGFPEAFGCREGDPMFVPTDKLSKIW